MTSFNTPFKVNLLFIYLFFLVFVYCNVNKYSEKANLRFIDDVNIEQVNPFRMKKINMLWNKAKKQLPSPQWIELFAELKLQDKYEAQLKKMKVENSDKDGTYESQVLQSHQKIIEKFGLQNIYYSNELPVVDKRSDMQYSDSRLQTLWEKAETSGFSADDLKLLKEEFWHQQMKVQELEFLNSEQNELPDPEDNSIDNEEKISSVKQRRKEMKDGYQRLEELMSSLPKTDPLFKDVRVTQLWALARRTNWTEEELDSFKEELLHFENRLTKENFYKEQLDISAQKLTSDEINQGYLERHKQLQEKHGAINKNVKKLHVELKTKVSKALHLEL